MIWSCAVPQVEGVVVGENYRFGYKARGDAKLLQDLGEQHGISVAITELLGANVPGRVGEVKLALPPAIFSKLVGGSPLQGSQIAQKSVIRLFCRLAAANGMISCFMCCARVTARAS